MLNINIQIRGKQWHFVTSLKYVVFSSYVLKYK